MKYSNEIYEMKFTTFKYFKEKRISVIFTKRQCEGYYCESLFLLKF